MKWSFRGRFDFGAGVQIVSAKNSYGKSLASKAIAWCLGVEMIFGIPANDTALSLMRFVRKWILRKLQERLFYRLSIDRHRSLRRALTFTNRVIIGGRPLIAVTRVKECVGTQRHPANKTSHHAGLDWRFPALFLRMDEVAPYRSIPTYAETHLRCYLENPPCSTSNRKKAGQAFKHYRSVDIPASNKREIATEYLPGATERIAQRVSEQDAAQRRLLLKQEADQIA